jgi:hypothetical protein
MGRKANPTCIYCAKNYRTEDEALEKHPECYIGHNCRIKRGRLRNKSQVNAKRRQNSARKKGITTIEPILLEAYRTNTSSQKGSVAKNRSFHVVIFSY